MDRQLNDKEPIPFRFDELGIYGDVFISNYSGIEFSPETVVGEYTIVLAVDNGFENILQNIVDSNINAILSGPFSKTGVGWIKNKYVIPQAEGWQTSLNAIKNMLSAEGAYATAGMYDYINAVRALANKESVGEPVTNGDNDNSFIDGPNGSYEVNVSNAIAGLVTGNANEAKAMKIIDSNLFKNNLSDWAQR